MLYEMGTKRFKQLEVMEQVRPLLNGVSGPKIKAPNIVVVGGQSSGKSSVLEHMIGLAFPRGEGMSTRVPTIVSVQGGCTESSLVVSLSPEYTEGEMTYILAPDDTKGFGQAIARLTDWVTEPGEINEQPIYVKLKRPNGPTFTVTDLPGITCMSKHVDGATIEKQTTELTRKMIGTSADTLVLVVLPATEDFHNSKALQLAMELDPEGNRTIGVVTKIDNLPPGSDLVRRMSGDEIRLRHGFFAVRNRTQKESNEGMKIEEVAQKEAALFETHEVLSLLLEEQRGMPRLLDKLAAEQGKCLDKSVPKMRSAVHERLRQLLAALDKLPTSLVDEKARLSYVSRRLNIIWQDFRKCIESDTSVGGAECEATNLSSGVQEVMMKLLGQLRQEIPDFLADKTKASLLRMARDSTGYHLSNFNPDKARMFRGEWTKSVAPVLANAADAAMQSTLLHVVACFDALVDLHVSDGVAPCLHVAIKQLFRETMDKTVKETTRLVTIHQQAEANVTFTTHQYYLETTGKFEQMLREHSHEWRSGKSVSGKSVMTTEDDALGFPKEFMEGVRAAFGTGSDNERAVRTVQVSLHAYRQIVQKRFTDNVAMLLTNELVMSTAATLTDEVINWSMMLVDKVKEDPGVADTRVTLTNDIERLRRALSLLDSL